LHDARLGRSARTRFVPRFGGVDLAQFAVDGNVQLIGQLDSAERLVTEALRLDPDVILLDIEMPGPDVFEMASRLMQARPNSRLVFLSAHVRDGYLASAYQCGASGYFAKGDELEHIVAGLKEGLLMNQLKAVGLTIVWSVVATAIIAYIVKAIIGLRPTDEVERQGLDINEHGEEGYVS
jgi:CheY-like chemotaxis protein